MNLTKSMAIINDTEVSNRKVVIQVELVAEMSFQQ